MDEIGVVNIIIYIRNNFYYWKSEELSNSLSQTHTMLTQVCSQTMVGYIKCSKGITVV